jgi:hypothetical protein
VKDYEYILLLEEHARTMKLLAQASLEMTEAGVKYERARVEAGNAKIALAKATQKFVESWINNEE